ncbi:MAG: hypothetical protein QGH77_00700, partial [Planctomycetota bacterium]|nr:hypothetical protein [Planctomycetota bacterium]
SMGIFLFLAACSSPKMQPPALEGALNDSGIQLDLPSACQHWQSTLIRELNQVRSEWENLRTWRSSGKISSEPLELRVCLDEYAAGRLMLSKGLKGSPRVARTYPASRLAIVPLPRRDLLLLNRARPPLTWLRTFRHEAAHLLSLDDSKLRESPLWFQEGIAEALAGDRNDPWFDAGLWRKGLTEERLEQGVGQLWEDLPAEGLLQARQALVSTLLKKGGEAPWEFAANWTIRDFLQNAGFSWPVKRIVLVRQRGREFDPPDSENPLLLATFPGQTCTAILEPIWEGRPLQFGVKLGASGASEGGLLVSGIGEKRLRVRFGRTGGVGLHQEMGPGGGFQALGPPAPTLARKERELNLEIKGDRLWVEVDGKAHSFSLEESFRAPFQIEAWTHDTAMTVRSSSDFREASWRPE